MELSDKKKKLHRLVDEMDENTVDSMLKRIELDSEIVGSRMDGTPVTLGELKEGIEKSKKEIEKGEFKTIDQLKKEADSW
jgi:hypothetical protein